MVVDHAVALAAQRAHPAPTGGGAEGSRPLGVGRRVGRGERGTVVAPLGVLGATTLTTVYYVAASARDAAVARRHVEDLLRLFEVAPVTRGVLESALGIGMSDYEDAVLHEAGQQAGVEALVTRDVRDFASGEITVYQPGELLAALDPEDSQSEPGSGFG